ncbi:hypothetical protein PRIPAC_82912 [Pristionchus pacificus]|uniref:Uncharacterized protein n=1 Tax=Pristionchus pacificus TaxID=54126 RepID=A0A2A6C4T6_PRIPA|nr:hypothetical protein PRIPAC_82912 [Pristionchus pacificus]|eukprot:PDM73108.1 hypothetical protein PRIPAC_39542 [Pristionchus pacificus]
MISFGEGYIYFCAGTYLMSSSTASLSIVHKRQERVGFYRFFTYAFVFIDVLYSFAFSAVQAVAPHRVRSCCQKHTSPVYK